MLMAYGFLRRVFEVFERYTTAVDVVTTSEVTVSVTVDDRRHLESIVEELSEFSQVTVDHEMALLCAVGDRLRNEPAIAARAVGVLEEVPLRMISQAASRRNITVILRQVDLPHAMNRLHEEFFADSARILIVGYGKMGQLVEQMAVAHGIEIASRIDVGTGDWSTPADVAVDFSTAAALTDNFPRYVRAEAAGRHWDYRLGRSVGACSGRRRSVPDLGSLRRRTSRSA